MYVQLIRDSNGFKAGTQFKVEESTFCDYTVGSDYYIGTVKVNDREVNIKANWSDCQHIERHEFTGEVIPLPPLKFKKEEWWEYINYP